MIARVRSVIAASIFTGSRLLVSGVTSTKTGTALIHQDAGCRRGECIGRDDDFVTRPDLQRGNGDMERCGTELTDMP